MMKKIVSIILVLASVAFVSACQKAAPADDFDPDAPVSYTLSQAKSSKRGMGYNNPVLPDKDVI